MLQIDHFSIGTLPIDLSVTCDFTDISVLPIDLSVVPIEKWGWFFGHPHTTHRDESAHRNDKLVTIPLVSPHLPPAPTTQACLILTTIIMISFVLISIFYRISVLMLIFSAILSMVYHLRMHVILQLMELEDNGCDTQDGLIAHSVLRVWRICAGILNLHALEIHVTKH